MGTKIAFAGSSAVLAEKNAKKSLPDETSPT